MSGDFDPPSSPGSNPPPPLNAPPPPPGYQQAPPPAYAGPIRPEPYPPDSRATASLVLGIAGLVLLVTTTGLAAPLSLPCSILGWIFGRGREGNGRVGRICGMIGVGLGVLAILIWGALIVAVSAED